MSLVFDQVHKRFGTVQALDGVSFSVEPGQVFGFLGANGAGKTTAMRIALDIIRADAGSVTWQGQPSMHLPRRTGATCPRSAASTRACRSGSSSSTSAACTGGARTRRAQPRGAGSTRCGLSSARRPRP